MIYRITNKIKNTLDNIINKTMYNTTRTNLLNYLNNNKIEYTFDKASQTITVDLTVTKE